MTDPTTILELLEYRRIVAEMYMRVREGGAGAKTWSHWRTDRDELFATHPQSALSQEAQDSFSGLPYFPYDPAWRIEATLEPIESGEVQIGHSGRGETGSTPVGRVRFDSPEGEVGLTLFWLGGYGGGLFLPFRDGTSAADTYGGGRYLLDTAKGADLGHADDRIVLDFNYSYHPSCVHNARWSCPLAPPENRLDIEIRAGERL